MTIKPLTSTDFPHVIPIASRDDFGAVLYANQDNFMVLINAHNDLVRRTLEQDEKLLALIDGINNTQKNV